jgi:hypothetical protein
MTEPSSIIPYEKQFDRQSTRTCGAACLTMIYRSLGQEVPQRLIWPLIAKKNLYDRIASTTHLMVADAINRGFAAVAIQARDPLSALRRCGDFGIRAILNHRLKSDSAAGHYTVLLDIDDTHVTLHDPYFGPSRRLPHSELLELWQARVPNSEIVGNFLIGIAAEPPVSRPCESCNTAMLPCVECPKCKNRVALQPSALLGCLNDTCSTRLWNYVGCPTCDLTWSFTIGGPQSAAASAISAASQHSPSVPPSPEDPLNLPSLFGELDKFTNYIMSFPALADHPEIKQQLDFITSSKETVRVAQAEALARGKLRHDQLTAMLATAQQQKEARRKKMEELDKPLPPLDGDALARALLKNLGFTS